MTDVIVTAAYPFVPAELKIYHLASTYIPADIHTRFLRAYGYDVEFVSGTDVHGIRAKRQIEQQDVSPETVLREYHETYAKQIKSFQVDFDEYEMLFGPSFNDRIQRAYRSCKSQGLISERETTVYRCTGCGYYLPRLFRQSIGDEGNETTEGFDDEKSVEQMACGFCGERQIKKESIPHYFLTLPSSEAYAPVIQNQHRGDVRNKLRSEAEGITKWDITRDDYFGVPHPGDNNLSFYLWFGSLAGLPTLLRPETVDQLQHGSGPEFHHFMGKNLTYYHGIVFPVIAEAGLGFENLESQLSPRGFMTEDDSSLSIEGISPQHIDYLRYYVMVRVTDTMNDFDLTREEFIDVTNNVVCDKIGGFFSRVCSILAKQDVQQVPSSPTDLRGLREYIQQVESAVLDIRTNAAVNNVQSYFDHAHGIISEQELYRDPSDSDILFLLGAVANGLSLLAPIMPTLVSTYNIFESWSPTRIPANLPAGTKISHDVGRWEKIGNS